MLQKIVHYFKSNPQKLFLIDGLGALTSAFSLGILLVQFESYFGMPWNILYVLAFLACLFAIYSMTCYLRTPENWQPWLKAIARINLLYCCLTLALVLFYYQQLTVLGIGYFIIEIIIIISLVMVELKTAAN